MQNIYVVFDLSFDEVGVNTSNGIVSPNNTFDSLEKAKRYTAKNKKPNAFQIIVDYQSNPKKIVEII